MANAHPNPLGIEAEGPLGLSLVAPGVDSHPIVALGLTSLLSAGDVQAYRDAAAEHTLTTTQQVKLVTGVQAEIEREGTPDLPLLQGQLLVGNLLKFADAAARVKDEQGHKLGLPDLISVANGRAETWLGKKYGTPESTLAAPVYPGALCVEHLVKVLPKAGMPRQPKLSPVSTLPPEVTSVSQTPEPVARAARKQSAKKPAPGVGGRKGKPIDIDQATAELTGDKKNSYHKGKIDRVESAMGVDAGWATFILEGGEGHRGSILDARKVLAELAGSPQLVGEALERFQQVQATIAERAPYRR